MSRLVGSQFERHARDGCAASLRCDGIYGNGEKLRVSAEQSRAGYVGSSREVAAVHHDDFVAGAVRNVEDGRHVGCKTISGVVAERDGACAVGAALRGLRWWRR